MQTTLRLNDQLYRAAKAEAARQGIPLTRLIEQAVAERLRRPSGRGEDFAFPVYAAGQPWTVSPGDLSRIAREEEAAHDLAKLGLR